MKAQIKTSELKNVVNATKNNTWTNANHIIENTLQVELIQDFPFMKMWAVKGNEDITTITNTMKYCGENIAKVTFCLNHG